MGNFFDFFDGVDDEGNDSGVTMVPGIGLIYFSQYQSILTMNIFYTGATRAEETCGNVHRQVQQVGGRNLSSLKIGTSDKWNKDV